MPTITLEPSGKQIAVAAGTPLQDVLFEYGVEFPCGGHGQCKGCKIRILSGDVDSAPESRAILGKAEFSAGWRLACRSRAAGDVRIELAQWQTGILEDSANIEGRAGDGFGIAVDLGTTTLAAQLMDLASGKILGSASGLNPQGRHGADIMTRLEFALTQSGAKILRTLIRNEIFALSRQLLADAGISAAALRNIHIVGNSAMHHIFCGLDAAPLSRYPFEMAQCEGMIFSAADLGWDLPDSARIEFLPCMGGFVGSDILAGILAVNMHQSADPVALIDLGTNGEIAIGNRAKILVASTAAGPAFEGAKISMGMRASSGAISEVLPENGNFICRTIGGIMPPLGICGSGLVDAVSTALELGLISASGRFRDGGDQLALCGPVSLSQQDIRELQSAKGAIAAGFEIVLKQMGITKKEVATVHLAGAFGNYVRPQSAVAIGLIPIPFERILPAGNSALRGAKLSLYQKRDIAEIMALVRHIPLGGAPDFQDIYVKNMLFP